MLMTSDFVEINSHKVRILKGKGQRHLRLRINSSGNAILSMPKRLPKYMGIKYLQTKTAWLDKHTFQPKQISFGSKLFTGQEISIVDGSNTRNRVVISKETLEFYLQFDSNDPASQRYMSKIIKNLYIDHLSKIVSQRLDYYSDLTKLKYRDFAVKNLRSKWGSCDRHKQLKFSLYLLGVDMALIDYVVLHELAHTKYMHHQPLFWKLCEQYMPDYKHRQKQLKT